MDEEVKELKKEVKELKEKAKSYEHLDVIWFSVIIVGIPVGAIYIYFEIEQDLYFYLIPMIGGLILSQIIRLIRKANKKKDANILE